MNIDGPLIVFEFPGDVQAKAGTLAYVSAAWRVFDKASLKVVSTMVVVKVTRKNVAYAPKRVIKDVGVASISEVFTLDGITIGDRSPTLN